ncbi:MAG: DUF4830 domain-containing protein [Clostridia bacterium]|nr:DUF4830 domain-containing protein [Clostridia bacterium]
MFVFSFKASTLKYIGVMSLCVMAIIMTVAIVPSNSMSSGMENGAIEVSAERKIGDFKNVKTSEDVVAFLKSYGWEVEDTPVSERSVTIPQEFDQLYEEYNKLQKGEGLDLEKYKGKTVDMYTYSITNADGKAYATVLVYKNRVIGGDVSSAENNGFTYGFSGK